MGAWGGLRGGGTEWGGGEISQKREEGGAGRRAQRWETGLGAGRPHMEPHPSCALPQSYYYMSVKALYTVGYSTSLVSLTTAMVILCRFR